MLDEYIWKDGEERSLIIKIKGEIVLNSMKKGVYWFQHPSFFIHEGLRDGGNRQVADRYECLINSIQSEEVYMSEGAFTLNIGGNRIGNNIGGNVKIINKTFNENKDIDKRRFISFYKLRIDKNGCFGKIDLRNLEFSDKFALINVCKLEQALRQKGYNPEFDDIDYYNEAYSGKVSYFMKDKSFLHQSEFRVMLIEDKFADEISQDSYLRDLDKRMEEQIDINCSISKRYPREDVLKSQHEIEKIEKEQHKYKGEQYKKIIELDGDFLSDIKNLEILLNANNINEIKDEF